MAITFTIRDTNSNISYDLYSGTLYTSPDSWRTAVSSGVVTENISLSGSGTNAALRVAFDTLDDLRNQVVKYANDPNEDNAIYLYKNSDGETAKRVRVIDMNLVPENVDGASSLLENIGVKATLTLIHPDFWEEVSGETPTANDLDWTNETAAFTNTAGNVDARIGQITIGWSAGLVNRIWLGIRPRRIEQLQLGGGTESPIMEIENGTPDTDTSLLSDASASPNGSSTNNYHGCDFTTVSGMARRTYFTLNQQLGATYNKIGHWAGRYRVLLRYRLTSSPATEVLVQLKYGMSGNSSLGGTRPVLLTAIPNWDLKEIGSISIPPWGDLKYGDGVLSSYILDEMQFEFWAELVTGTAGTSFIDFDAIILIPAEHYIYIEGAYLNGAGDSILVNTGSDGSYTVYQYESTKPTRTLPTSADNWYMPPGNSDIVIAIAREDDSHQMLDEVDLSLLVYETYFNYAG